MAERVGSCEIEGIKFEIYREPLLGRAFYLITKDNIPKEVGKRLGAICTAGGYEVKIEDDDPLYEDLIKKFTP